MGDKNMDLAVKMLQLFPTFHFCLQPIKTRMAVILTSFFCQPYFCLTLLPAARMTGSRFMDHVLWVSVRLA
jgi:hypothetical protein